MALKNWTKASIDDVVNLIIDYRGKTPKKLGVDWQESGIPAISAKNIKQGQIVRQESIKYVSHEMYQIWMKDKLQPNDVILTSEAPLGEILYLKKVEPMVLSQRLFALRLDTLTINPRYFAYYIESKEGQSALKSKATGTTAQGIRQTLLREVDVYFPDNLATQQKIASILSAYDDLIENNNRRIKILEEIAQRIYREWFIHFRYPGHEDVPLVDSELGKIPEGWEVRRLSDKYSIHKGLSYRSKDLVESGGIPMINLKNINKGGGFRSDGVKYYVGEFKESHEVSKGDVIVAVTDMTADRSIAGRAARIPRSKTKAIISADLVRIEPLERISQSYTYGLFSFSTLPLYLKEFATGTNVQHLSPSSISIQKIIVPPKSLQDEYGFILENPYELADNLDSNNQNLRKTRDLLLPKLISGQLDVEDLDIKV